MPTRGCASRGMPAGPPGPSSAVLRWAIRRSGAEAVRRSSTSFFACARGLRAGGAQLADHPATAASRSSATSCTSPIRSAVAASKRSPVTK
jgi:hypothetical protein